MGKWKNNNKKSYVKAPIKFNLYDNWEMLTVATLNTSKSPTKKKLVIACNWADFHKRDNPFISYYNVSDLFYYMK